jgi:DNA-3-methyladenine glycosylase I
MKPKERKRCGWAQGDPLKTDSIMQAYHDDEWGVPLHDDRKLLESIVLDGAQAGLSWRTILLRRDGYRKAFHNFDAKKMAQMGAKDVARLMKDTGIIRNRAKILSAIQNAKAFLAVQKEFGSFDKYIWGFAPKNRKVQKRLTDYRHLPVTSPEAEAMSKDLRKRGFNFVGPTICYAFMQAAGLVDDHLHGCFRTLRHSSRSSAGNPSAVYQKQ